MRIIFDASSQDVGELSLNNCLWPGANLNPNILDRLINFRLNKIVFIADIEKAFLQISLAEKDRDTLRFLRFEDSVQVYRFNHVLFGVNAFPFPLTATIKKHVTNFHAKCPTTVKIMDKYLYVNDFIAGVDHLQDALEIYRNAFFIMAEIRMMLKKWSTDDNDLMD